MDHLYYLLQSSTYYVSRYDATMPERKQQPFFTVKQLIACFTSKSNSLTRCLYTGTYDQKNAVDGLHNMRKPRCHFTHKSELRYFRTSGKVCGEVLTMKCPAFAESISEGDVRWEKAVGDFVNENEAIGEIETAKTSIPVLASKSGVIMEFCVEDGATVTPGDDIYKFELKEGSAPPAAAPKPAAPTPTPAPEPKMEVPAPPPPVSMPPPPAQAVVQIQEAAGRIPEAPPSPPPLPQAPISSIPVSQLMPQHAAPPQQQVLKAGKAPTTITGTRTEARVKMSRMRQRIAERLKEAQNTTAMLTTFNEIDMSNIFGMRNQYRDAFLKKFHVKLGFMSAFVKASASALQEQPVVNAVIDGKEIVYRDYVDISVAVATPKGLVVPVVRNVEGMNFADIELNINELGEKARSGSLAVEDMDGGTFSISNGGVFRSLFGTPIINPPQSAILGMYGVFDRPVAISGKVEIRPMMYVALTYDHRLVDGREAVLFLRKVKSCVEDPRTLLLDL
ncbi:PREDICTED: dihydrolipoyllysine-residue succinyltransferase component of 2-oxoglutarate dehydrogenase complex, mitochondrial-like [Priapulus caudatus]|uniref:Dihydrolipoyllysine-residue succinyltransferase component of 2-oxoglutarate dehydrogenase complex, mitochondrial n=1 Tax=Priapulus caudatus TaxID=37621 RepID=A0ABM1EFV2_PRICU|nr:PREDICTED: dihydrolipoyllysine-residue succinyltransferase component of 2-oxoglutarate dehydrogenase complex, mitochondrial-like [Priapulus caudatus]